MSVSEKTYKKWDREILEMLVEGLSDTQMASKAGLNPRSFGYRIRGMMGRMEASTRAHAVALAYQKGILTVPVTEPPEAAPLVSIGVVGRTPGGVVKGRVAILGTETNLMVYGKDEEGALEQARRLMAKAIESVLVGYVGGGV